jgi:superfamily II DNA or RNA helicase
MIHFEYFNESFLKIRVEDYGVEQELYEFFSFFAPGYKFMPSYRKGIFDGKIRLFNLRNKQLPRGLLNIDIKFCDGRDYEFSKDPQLDSKTGITLDEVKDFVRGLNLHTRGKPLEYRDYQLEAIWKCLSDKRGILVAPTSSGKSAIIYSKIRYHLDNMGQNVLLVVPSTQLVEQMFSDFKDYSSENGWDVEENVQILYAGKDRVFSKKVLISTWQSLAAMAKNDPETLKQIVDKTDVGIFDEAHTLGKGTVVIDTVNRFTKTAWRTGTTGTLDDSKIHQLNLIGLLGDPYQVITTKELMDAGQVTPLKIKILLLKHQEELRKFYKGSNYIDEISYLVGSEQRNRFIANLAKACEGPTLILVNFIERHGQVLTDMIKEIVPADRMVEFVHGGVDVKEREQIRKIVEEVKNPILVANASLFSTGTNIPALENIIFGISSKSSIRVRQSIGRGLRLKSGKKYCTLFDISDDLSWKSYQNTTLKHMRERVAIYDKEQFDYKILNIDLK